MEWYFHALRTTKIYFKNKNSSVSAKIRELSVAAPGRTSNSDTERDIYINTHNTRVKQHKQHQHIFISSRWVTEISLLCCSMLPAFYFTTSRHVTRRLRCDCAMVLVEFSFLLSLSWYFFPFLLFVLWLRWCFIENVSPEFCIIFPFSFPGQHQYQLLENGIVQRRRKRRFESNRATHIYFYVVASSLISKKAHKSENKC